MNGFLFVRYPDVDGVGSVSLLRQKYCDGIFQKFGIYRDCGLCRNIFYETIVKCRKIRRLSVLFMIVRNVLLDVIELQNYFFAVLYERGCFRYTRQYSGKCEV